LRAVDVLTPGIGKGLGGIALAQTGGRALPARRAFPAEIAAAVGTALPALALAFTGQPHTFQGMVTRGVGLAVRAAVVVAVRLVPPAGPLVRAVELLQRHSLTPPEKAAGGAAPFIGNLPALNLQTQVVHAQLIGSAVAAHPRAAVVAALLVLALGLTVELTGEGEPAAGILVPVSTAVVESLFRLPPAERFG